MKTLILLLAPLAACTLDAPTAPDAPAIGAVSYTYAVGTLLWHDGTTNTETPRLSDCKPA